MAPKRKAAAKPAAAPKQAAAGRESKRAAAAAAKEDEEADEAVADPSSAATAAEEQPPAKVAKVADAEPEPERVVTEPTKSSAKSSSAAPAAAIASTATAAPKASSVSAVGAEQRKRSLFNPTIQELESDELTHLANKHWRKGQGKGVFDKAIVEQIFHQELAQSGFAFARIMLLEFSQYLERFLWPHFSAHASSAHLISIVLMINEKFRERVPAFAFLGENDGDKFNTFFSRLLPEFFNNEHSQQIQNTLLIFLINCFQSLEVLPVRQEILRLVSLTTWNTILESKREVEFKKHPKLAKMFKQYAKQLESLDATKKASMTHQRTFLSSLITKFLNVLSSIRVSGPVDELTVRYCDRFLELMIDLECQIPTRRYFNTVFDDHDVIAQCRCSDLIKRKEGALFKELLETLDFYAGFEINEHSGVPLTDIEMTELHTSALVELQQVVYEIFGDSMEDFALSHTGAIDSRKFLQGTFGKLDDAQLRTLANHLQIRTKSVTGVQYSREVLVEILIRRHEKHVSQIDAINATPLYPNEKVLWNPASVKTDYYSGEHCLALPKLNLQFLTVHDYLLRNYNLYRLESNYEIREDIEEVVQRMQPRESVDGSTEFGGWARMGVQINSFVVGKVSKPNLGETKPSRVTADVTFSVGIFRDHIRKEWEAIRQHDILFLVSVQASAKAATKWDKEDALKNHSSFADHFGVVHVRGCEVLSVLDQEGEAVEEWKLTDKSFRQKGEMRTLRVLLDPSQYAEDLHTNLKEHDSEDVYSSFNIIIRRKPQENNFKAVLETIRDLMKSNAVVPPWLHDVFLGYGDPGAAHYSKMPTQQTEFDFNDTFLSADHLVASFPNHHVQFSGPKAKAVAPFKVTVTSQTAQGKSVLIATPYSKPNRGPYPANQAKTNTVEFTATQVEAIKSGMSPGLTMIVGPPGTGKTDVAVQIVNNLYHNNPEQHTLIITHSNQALNQIFEKVIRLDIDERHCLRLGHGEEDLQSEKDFSKYGRVDYFLQKRFELLAEVDRLAKSLNVSGDFGYTCDTAGHFFRYHIEPAWEKYLKLLSGTPNASAQVVAALFPFKAYFANAPQPLFPISTTTTFAEAMEIANGCFKGHLQNVFDQLEEMRAFELVRTGWDRGNYLLTKEAKIIAMTCTHAALKRPELVELAFKYDNIILEEAAQILEVETFIPMLLQNTDDGVSRLKRVVLIGDHNQLPPVVKNMSFQRYGNMEQSLFARFVRSGVPTIDLDAQGRARPSLSKLYSWRYKGLGDLPVVKSPEFKAANAGFAYDYQLIDVGDFMGKGEVETSPHFYQNVGEAEFVVAVYQYMRLIGYPAEKISILTTYNGQRDLINDVLQRRCAWNPLFGRPQTVSTVDKFQGQQNDYILLSLVRTRSVGHLRDIRRLVVALSRARLGLYVFGRKQLFEDCVELAPAFGILDETPTKLTLALGETHPNTSRSAGEPGQTVDIENVEHMGQFVHQLTQEQMKRVQAAASQAYQQQQASLQQQQQDQQKADDVDAMDR